MEGHNSGVQKKTIEIPPDYDPDCLVRQFESNTEPVMSAYIRFNIAAVQIQSLIINEPQGLFSEVSWLKTKVALVPDFRQGHQGYINAKEDYI